MDVLIFPISFCTGILAGRTEKEREKREKYREGGGGVLAAEKNKIKKTTDTLLQSACRQLVVKP